MDTVILAAGRNERLNGLTNPFTKPLATVNGQPLLVSLVQMAEKYSNQITVVVAPENALAIRNTLRDADLLTNDLHMVVQPSTRGPGDALLRGLEVSRDQRTMVLCGDNIIMLGDIQRMADDPYPFQVGVAYTPDADRAVKFTRITPEYFTEEGPIKAKPWPADEEVAFERYLLWLGPLVVPTDDMYRVLKGQQAGVANVAIGENLRFIRMQMRTVNVTAYDIGEPETYMRHVEPKGH
jgi:hypothetical protein